VTPSAISGPIDSRRLEELYQAHWLAIFRVCHGLLRSAADAEDAAQETFARAARRLEGVVGDPLPYLRTIARNVCIDQLRERKHVCDAVDDDRADGRFASEDRALDRSLIGRVWHGLNGQEQSLLARAFAGFSCQEIARHHGTTEGAVYMAISRARARARDLRGKVSGALLLPAQWLRNRLQSSRQLGSGADALGQLGGGLSLSVGVAVVAGCLASGVPSSALPVADAGTGRAASAAFLPDSATTRMATVDSFGRGAPAAVPPGTAGPGGSAPQPSPGRTDPVNMLVSPGSDARQQDVSFDQVTPSPTYSTDHTVYASGLLMTGCTRPQCPVIFASSDGAHSWHAVPAKGFTGGSLALSPAFDQDHTLFAAGNTGLLVSRDGGASFLPAAPMPGPAATLPGTAAGASTVLFGQGPLLVYDAATGRIAPGPSLPAGIGMVSTMRFLDSSGDVLLAAEDLGNMSAGVPNPVVVRCALHGACATVLEIATPAAMTLYASPASPFVVAAAGQITDQSSDGGVTFSRVADLPGQVTAIALAAGGVGTPRVLFSDIRTVPSGIATDLDASTDGARSISRVATSGLPTQSPLDALVILPDGHVLAAVHLSDPSGDFGIRCSRDGGITWVAAC